MPESTMRGVIEFFDKIGIFDVVLPFLLVFTIVFAILEKTKVFGMEKVGKDEVTKKNLNSLAAFVIAFLVVASSELVAVITQVSANMVVLLMLSVLFLILVGTFHEDGKPIALQKGWKSLFMVIMFLGIVAIFMDALETDNGDTWLEHSMDFIQNNWSSTGVASIILIIFLVGVVYWIQKPESGGGEKKSE